MFESTCTNYCYVDLFCAPFPASFLALKEVVVSTQDGLFIREHQNVDVVKTIASAIIFPRRLLAFAATRLESEIN